VVSLYGYCSNGVDDIVCCGLCVIDRCLASEIVSIPPDFPFGWQILFGMMFFAYTHGFPSEMFSGFMFAIFWSFFALIGSYRLYRYPMIAMKILAFCQFMESVCALYLTGLEYISACWRFYGHIVWNP
jgi:hypothetical protein